VTTKNVTIPDLGGAADVTVIEVLVKPGDVIQKEAAIVTLESDKATLEVPSTESGVIKTVNVKVGDKVSTGSVLITLASDAAEKNENIDSEKVDKVDKEKTKKTEKVDKIDKIETKEKSEKIEKSDTKEKAEKPAKTAEKPATILTGTLETTGNIHAGPGVRRMAREFGVNLMQVSGTGPKQRILKEDIQQFVKTQLTQMQNQSGMQLPTTATMNLPAIDFSKFGVTETLPLSRIKKISGKVLQRNWAMIPHVTQFGEADITSLEEFRLAQKIELEKQKIKLTPVVFVMKAVVSSLRAFPHFNASLEVNGEELVMKKYFNIGVAVDTPDGLVVPVVRDVDKKGLIDLAKELAEISEKARHKQLTPMDMQGGCISISSLGGIGGTAFTPIINYPEVAILGVSKAAYKPVYQDGTFVPRLMLPLSLSYDHRVIDGADGARFMMHLSNMLSDIRNLLL